MIASSACWGRSRARSRPRRVACRCSRRWPISRFATRSRGSAIVAPSTSGSSSRPPRPRGRGRSLCLVLCDLDNLRDLNEAGGHQVGDDALQTGRDRAGRGGRRPPGVPARRRRVHGHPRRQDPRGRVCARGAGAGCDAARAHALVRCRRAGSVRAQRRSPAGRRPGALRREAKRPRPRLRRLLRRRVGLARQGARSRESSGGEEVDGGSRSIGSSTARWPRSTARSRTRRCSSGSRR